jgi:hypothetical protein
VNDRLFTLLCALGAFVLFYGFFIGDFVRRDADNAPSRPLSTEERPNGYRALWDWLEVANVRHDSLRHRYDWLLDGSKELPRGGNIMIVSLPAVRPPRDQESNSLTDWVRRGNTLVVLAALFDTPDWGVNSGNMLGELHTLTLLDFTLYKPKKIGAQPGGDTTDYEPNVPPIGLGVEPLATPKAERMRARGRHPLTEGVESVSALSEYASYKFTVASPEQGAILELMDDVGTGIPALWAGPLDEGTVVVSGYGSILTNKMLGRADNARLIANLLAWRLGPQGVVLFDDMHQGASSFYDADAFYSDPRLHATFWWIMGVWLAWAVLGTRLRARRRAITAPRESRFIRSVGNFFARAVPAHAAGERMCAHLFNDIRRSLGWPQNGEPVWDWLRSLSVVPAAEITALFEMHARLAAGGKVPLTRLQNLILAVRKQVL